MGRFRYDVFLSYARSTDGTKYAKQLRDHLKKLDFTVFLDETEIHAGDPLWSTLEQALNRSAVLAVVGTREAAKSAYVEKEVRHFATTGQKIIPINIGGAITDWDVVRDQELVWIDDSAEALAHGSPSLKVAEEINRVFQFRKRNAIRRLQTIGVALLFVVVAAASAVVIGQQIARRNEAEKRAMDRTAQAEAAEKQALAEKVRAYEATQLAKEKTAAAAMSERLAHERLVDTRQEQGRFELLRGNREQALVSLAKVYRERPQDNVVRALVASAARGVVTHIAAANDSIVGAAWSADGQRIVTLVPSKADVQRCVQSCPGYCWSECAFKSPREATVWNREGERIGTLRGPKIFRDRIAFSRRADRVFTMSKKGVVVWNARSRRSEGEIALPEDVIVQQLLPTPDGKRLLVAGSPQSFLLDADKRAILATLAPHVSLSADGKTFTAQQWQSSVGVHRTADGAELQTFDGGKYDVAALSADGKSIALAADDRVLLFDVGTKEQVGETTVDRGGDDRLKTIGLDFHPGGARILVTVGLPDGSGGFTEWATDQGLWATTTPAPTGAFARQQPLHYSPDGQRVVDYRGEIFGLGEGQLQSLTHPNAILDASFTDDGSWLITASVDGVRIWDALDDAPLATRFPSPRLQHPFAVTRDGRSVVVLNGGTATLYDMHSGKRVKGPVRYAEGDSSSNPIVDVSNDGRRAVVTDGGYHLIDFDSEKASSEPDEVLVRAAISADGNWLAYQDGYVIELRAVGEKKRHALDGANARFAPTGALITYTDIHGDFHVYDPAARKSLLTESGCTGAVSPDGAWAAVVTCTPTHGLPAPPSSVRLISLHDRREVPLAWPDQYMQDDARTHRLAFSDDSRTLAAAPAKGSVCLWSVPDGKLLRSLGTSETYVAHPHVYNERFDFDATGERLAVLESNKVKVWDVRRGLLIGSLHGPHNLTGIRFVGNGDRLVGYSPGGMPGSTAALPIWLTPREDRSPAEIERLLERIPPEVRATVDASLAASKTSP